jgi:CBS-domain-containing membrane protein
MELTAKDIMTKDFDTIREDAPILDAVRKILSGKVRETGHKTVSLMVTDAFGSFVGMISMMDILYHVRPPFFDYTVDWEGVTEAEVPFYVDRFRGLVVGQVMSTLVPTASPNDMVLKLIDVMVKEKVRNLPVIQDSKVIGIVYLSEVFITLCKKWLLA